ncbi:uncharacterized protein LOC125031296 [Penaeus chinensis]|uniref:uncharacterized protein LOC125031296 n=1 Tax=Penaeus chinensis TaxID=139456 RepID=UPI001FB72967|nr:uncharacterized protein LOC125031296 [Penaeus chinensis]
MVPRAFLLLIFLLFAGSAACLLLLPLWALLRECYPGGLVVRHGMQGRFMDLQQVHAQSQVQENKSEESITGFIKVKMISYILVIISSEETVKGNHISGPSGKPANVSKIPEKSVKSRSRET